MNTADVFGLKRKSVWMHRSRLWLVEPDRRKLDMVFQWQYYAAKLRPFLQPRHRTLELFRFQGSFYDQDGIAQRLYISPLLHTITAQGKSQQLVESGYQFHGCLWRSGAGRSKVVVCHRPPRLPLHMLPLLERIIPTVHWQPMPTVDGPVRRLIRLNGWTIIRWQTRSIRYWACFLHGSNDREHDLPCTVRCRLYALYQIHAIISRAISWTTVWVAGRQSNDILNLTVTTLNYRFDVRHDHHFNVMVGQEGGLQAEGFNVTTRGQNNDFPTNVTSGTRASSWQDNTTAYSFLSFFGRAEYSTMTVIMWSLVYVLMPLHVSVRITVGASLVSWGLMWNAKKERFLQNTTGCTMHKYRSSTGTSGNSEIPNFDHLALASGGWIYMDAAGIAPQQKGNEKLSWGDNLDHELRDFIWDSSSVSM